MFRSTYRPFRTGLLIGLGIMAFVRAVLAPQPDSEELTETPIEARPYSSSQSEPPTQSLVRSELPFSSETTRLRPPLTEE